MSQHITTLKKAASFTGTFSQFDEAQSLAMYARLNAAFSAGTHHHVHAVTSARAWKTQQLLADHLIGLSALASC